MRAVFKTFNNFTPLDVFGYMQQDEVGNFDTRRTLLQASLSQLTPFVKVPAEIMLGEDFFTGRSLEDARNIGDVDIDKMLGHIAGVAVGGSGAAEGSLMSGAGGVAAGALLGKILGALPMDDAKEKVASFLGIEEGVDRDGNRAVYMNAYAMHLLTAVPVRCAHVRPGPQGAEALQDAGVPERCSRAPAGRTLGEDPAADGRAGSVAARPDSVGSGLEDGPQSAHEGRPDKGA
jgi:hypothetical protein